MTLQWPWRTRRLRLISFFTLVILATEVKLTKVKNDISVLEAFSEELNSQWSDIGRRNIGLDDWAPKISVDVNNGRYTLDIGTFWFNEARSRPNFAGNIVDLGAFCLIFLISHNYLI
jgi:hypothetical protein